MFLSIDVGNSRVKLAVFVSEPNATTLPRATLALAGDLRQWGPLDDWLAKELKDQPFSCWMASVQRSTSSKLLEHLRQRHQISHIHTLAWQDFPLQVVVDQPECVGVDRLAAAFAAHCLTDKSRAAIVVDFGSAITVDRVSASGEFEGGAILPGLSMAAEALHHSTDALPHVELNYGDDAPAVLGRSTAAAITSGLYWGAVGAVRELVAKFAHNVDPEPAVFATGGAAQWLTPNLGSGARYEPDLVLRGIAQTARRLTE